MTEIVGQSAGAATVVAQTIIAPRTSNSFEIARCIRIAPELTGRGDNASSLQASRMKVCLFALRFNGVVGATDITEMSARWQNFHTTPLNIHDHRFGPTTIALPLHVSRIVPSQVTLIFSLAPFGMRP